MTTTPPEAEMGEQEVLAHLSSHIRYVAPASLAPLGRKARTHSKDQIRLIAQSMKAFGFNVPVLVDEDDKVIAGNGRIEAAIQLGIKEIPAITLSHLSASQKRAFVLAENQLATLAGWDKATLRLEFSELLTLDLDFDIEATGFLEPQIDAIVLGSDAASGKDAIPAPPVVPTSRVGDLWLLGPHRLLCGDATSPEVVRTLMNGEKARAAFLDAPYNVPINGHVSSSGLHGEFVMGTGEMSDEEFTDFLSKTLARVAESLVEGGLIYFCMDFRHMHNVLAAGNASSLRLVNLIVWDKGVGGMGSHYRSRHELIFLFVTAGASALNRVQLGKHGRDRHNVWAYPGVQGFGAEKARARELHPTVKPLAMVRDALLDCTARGDLVIDLFSGSGTTIVAAQEAGRRGAATELDPRYADTTIMRWQDFSGQEARLASTGQTFREVRAARSAAPDDLTAAPVARARTRRAA